jgi:hypothetical protein
MPWPSAAAAVAAIAGEGGGRGAQPPRDSVAARGESEGGGVVRRLSVPRAEGGRSASIYLAIGILVYAVL